MKIIGIPLIIKPFPVDKIAKMQTIGLKTPAGDLIEVIYKDIALKVINEHLCFFYESKDGDLIMPICSFIQIKSYIRNRVKE